ncbi:MAG: type IV secretion system DNA-binding domain-containing protein [Roseiarcus sp.]
MLTNHETILGTLSTGESVPLLQADRRRHVYVVGMTGTGKTGLLLNLMHADLQAGAGFCFLDPHGDASQHIASLAPKERRTDVIYLDPSDPTHTFAYNPLSNVPEAERATIAANIVSAFKNIWANTWGARLEYILGHSIRMLLDTRDQTLLGLPRLLVDDDYRHHLVVRCQDPVVRAFWLTEYAAYDTRFRNEAIAPIQNKVGAFLANPFIRSILCQNSSTLKIPDVMNKGKVLVVNLSKGNLGTEPAHLLGALLITACSQAAEARRHVREHERRDFTLYVDEFQNFATESFASILSEARKWRLSLVAANQTISQLPDGLQQSVFGNAGTLVVFRVGSHDAKRLAAELGMSNPATLTQTNNHHAWIKLMRDGAPLEPRLIATLAPPPPGARLAKVVAFAHARHMMLRKPVEERIAASFPKAPKRRPRHRGKRDPDSADF